jgi:hypothetical protein
LLLFVEDATGEFAKFLDFLGDRIPLKEWQGLRGDLDLKGLTLFDIVIVGIVFLSHFDFRFIQRMQLGNSQSIDVGRVWRLCFTFLQCCPTWRNRSNKSQGREELETTFLSSFSKKAGLIHRQSRVTSYVGSDENDRERTTREKS